MEKRLARERMLGPDLVRITACFCVLSVHFFLNNGFYSEQVQGAKMFIMVFMRSAFMVCVPLFLLLTGYLMRNQKLEKRYYLKGVRTLGIYLLASAACIVYRLAFLKTETPYKVITGILSYNAAPYAWYVEMYFGLFVLIPFLNILYRALPSKKAKWALIGTFLFLTSVPQAVNIFQFTDAAWWLRPSSGTEYLRLLPQWWRGIYPVTYYFIGAYIGEYRPRVPRWGLRALLAVTLLFRGLFNCWRSYGGKFVWGVWDEWGSVMLVVPATLILLLLADRDGARCPKPARKAIAVVSDLTLGVYLVSYIFDNRFYSILRENVPVMTDRLPYYFVIVPAVFVCSLALSGVLELIWRLGEYAVKRLRARRRGAKMKDKSDE